MPFIESWNHLVPTSYYRGKNSVRFIDIFDTKEQTKLENRVKFICQRSRNNPNTIGYCWTDLGSWPLENPSGKNWVDYIRNLPKGTPGQTAYQKFLLAWDGEKGKARDRSFLRLIAREYFRIVGTAQRKFAPNHLVFGERFSFGTLVPEIFEKMPMPGTLGRHSTRAILLVLSGATRRILVKDLEKKELSRVFLIMESRHAPDCISQFWNLTSWSGAWLPQKKNDF